MVSTLAIFMAYGIVSELTGAQGMKVSQAVTSLAALNLLSVPLATLVWGVPVGWAALGCFSRIQAFLIQESRTDGRAELMSNEGLSTPQWHPDAGLQLRALTNTPDAARVRLANASFGWSKSAPAVVKDVTMAIPRDCKLTIVVGPVGCGKSTLLKGLLGETPEMQGLVQVSSRTVAYCDQTPWIINGTIRDNIIGDSKMDSSRYQRIIQACALDVDLQLMPEGDLALTGDKGLSLSGGQRQRIVSYLITYYLLPRSILMPDNQAIARACYAQKPLVILDDVLSALDSVTEEHVFTRVIGRNGLLRETDTTLILATHNGEILLGSPPND
jgi:ATP-binding cassette, subfamily C (CFTR/MRP), member 1